MKLIECVPNFSEGRDAAVVDGIVSAMLAVPGVYLLAREMDADHHRSVITLAGDPAAVAEAAVRGAGEAARRIDLRHHQGAHPRIGATDVIPFVPLQGVTLEECVALAEWAGEEIWKRFGIPVYLYESAARRPDRRGLENLRRGQFEGLSQAVAEDPSRLPDFGDAALHPSAGATVVGARRFLIAYNINLDTPDIEIARQIARTVRASSGGLPGIKAMGVMLQAKNRAQVSMNVTDFEATSLATVWRVVGAEAAKLGTRALESELIGLAPRKAIEAAAAELLQLESFESEMVVENRVATVMSGVQTSLGAQLQPFLQALASDAPAPGGGSAAGAAGAMAAALGQMLCRLARAKGKRKPDAAFDAEAVFEPPQTELAAIEAQLVRAVDQDAEAFLAIGAAMRLPKASELDKVARTAAIYAATVQAAEVPLAVATRCARILELAAILRPRVPAAMMSDLTTAIALARAAFSGAHDNVAINLDSLPDHHPQRQRLDSELKTLVSRLQQP